MNKVVETRASRETAPPPDGLANEQKSAQKSDGAAQDDAVDSTSKRDPVEEVQEQAHPFN